VSSERSPAVLVVLVLVPVVVYGGLLVLAATTGLAGGAWGFAPLLTTVLGLLVPLVGLYLLARVVGELERIADALESTSPGPDEAGEE